MRNSVRYVIVYNFSHVDKYHASKLDIVMEAGRKTLLTITSNHILSSLQVWRAPWP